MWIQGECLFACSCDLLSFSSWHLFKNSPGMPCTTDWTETLDLGCSAACMWNSDIDKYMECNVWCILSSFNKWQAGHPIWFQLSCSRNVVGCLFKIGCFLARYKVQCWCLAHCWLTQCSYYSSSSTSATPNAWSSTGNINSVINRRGVDFFDLWLYNRARGFQESTLWWKLM